MKNMKRITKAVGTQMKPLAMRPSEQKTLAKSLVMSLLGCAAMSSQFAAAADDTFWYLGGNIGQSRAKIDDARIASQLTGINLPPSSISDDKSDTGYKLFGGYQFNKNLAVEGGYFDLGQFGFTAITVPAGTLSGNIKLKGLNLDAVGKLPLADKFSVFGRLGLQYAQAKDTFSSSGAVPPPTNPSPSKNALNYKAGVGVQYDFNRSMGMRIEAERYRVDDAVGNKADINLVSVGLVYRFGKKTPVVASVGRDTTSPYVTLVAPYKGDTGAPVYRKARVSFSEVMDSSTINSNTVSLYQGKTSVPGTALTPTGTTASFTPSSNLAHDTVYTGRVTTGVKDLAGNALPSDYVWSFKTAPTAETKVVVFNKFVMLEDTHFKFDEATLTNAGEDMLNQNIQIMKGNPDLKVRIAGYTSAAGTPEYNQELSERRADAVVAYMVKGGVAPERFDSIGYGENRPAVYEPIPADINSKAAKANMRVLFEVIVK